ncbi:MAG: hypothetical protein COV72_07810 [Candidatus Omnitrophica bacterium CG11_big_fil_rev_8_21_14_0_20_42_13]|uniref:Dihydroorotate dehydrogenase B (NAD(+)), electron transfer subunit n=1 Tax=Candidatus Ghiorseimicrobium undicola TaxID=1974746 RepID=A0A2H0LYF7_9BACT|nr:MAG: hypothetical protein COV72_07810 [Candidatus Omnitrophica bacterium CG11_big_fil_rev_8_21_14_0_20_42_13]
MKKIIIQEKIKIISNSRVGRNHFRLILCAKRIASLSIPGQFIEVRVAEGYEPLLRRPFSIHHVKGPNIEIFYQAIGRGTEILSRKKAGEFLDVIGPLGKGFSILNTQYSILVAGGMGVAPLVFLAEKLKECKSKNAKCKIVVLLGAKTKNHIFCQKEFKKAGCDVKISTDDGSSGFGGRVTDLLKSVLLNTQYLILNTQIYACGPKPMLKEIGGIVASCGLAAQVSLEEYMACGIGACLGCAAQTKSGYKYVCKDGPVFKAEELT